MTTINVSIYVVAAVVVLLVTFGGYWLYTALSLRRHVSALEQYIKAKQEILEHTGKRTGELLDKLTACSDAAEGWPSGAITRLPLTREDPAWSASYSRVLLLRKLYARTRTAALAHGVTINDLARIRRDVYQEHDSAHRSTKSRYS